MNDEGVVKHEGLNDNLVISNNIELTEQIEYFIIMNDNFTINDCTEYLESEYNSDEINEFVNSSEIYNVLIDSIDDMKKNKYNRFINKVSA